MRTARNRATDRHPAATGPSRPNSACSSQANRAEVPMKTTTFPDERLGAHLHLLSPGRSRSRRRVCAHPAHSRRAQHRRDRPVPSMVPERTMGRSGWVRAKRKIKAAAIPFSRATGFNLPPRASRRRFSPVVYLIFNEGYGAGRGRGCGGGGNLVGGGALAELLPDEARGSRAAGDDALLHDSRFARRGFF